MSEVWKQGFGSAIGHRETKGAETDRLDLTLSRQISTLPIVTICDRHRYRQNSGVLRMPQFGRSFPR